MSSHFGKNFKGFALVGKFEGIYRESPVRVMHRLFREYPGKFAIMDAQVVPQDPQHHSYNSYQSFTVPMLARELNGFLTGLEARRIDLFFLEPDYPSNKQKRHYIIQELQIGNERVSQLERIL